jgi:hypothetical protein
VTLALRGSLLVATAATATVAAWLLFTALFVLPRHDPGHVLMWTLVAVASGGLVATSIVATRDADPAPPAVTVLLVGLSMMALVFGLVAALSFLTGNDEGYLLVIGVVLILHGMLGLIWSGRLIRAREPR